MFFFKIYIFTYIFFLIFVNFTMVTSNSEGEEKIFKKI